MRRMGAFSALAPEALAEVEGRMEFPRRVCLLMKVRARVSAPAMEVVAEREVGVVVEKRVRREERRAIWTV